MKRVIALAIGGVLLPICTLVMNFGYLYSIPNAVKASAFVLGGIFSGWVASHHFKGGLRGFSVGVGWAVIVLAGCLIGYVKFDQYEGHSMAPLLLLPFVALGVLGGTYTGKRSQATMAPPNNG